MPACWRQSSRRATRWRPCHGWPSWIRIRPLVEPFLLSYLGRLGRTNLTPVPAELRARAFDAVFTAATAQAWRGVPHIDSELRTAIVEAYAPYCVLGAVLAHLPAGHAPDATSLAGRVAGYRLPSARRQARRPHGSPSGAAWPRPHQHLLAHRLQRRREIEPNQRRRHRAAAT